MIEKSIMKVLGLSPMELVEMDERDLIERINSEFEYANDFFLELLRIEEELTIIDGPSLDLLIMSCNSGREVAFTIDLFDENKIDTHLLIDIYLLIDEIIDENNGFSEIIHHINECECLIIDYDPMNHVGKLKLIYN